MKLLLANSEAESCFSVGVDALKKDTPLLDTLELLLKAVEDDLSVRTVGKGSYPNMCGVMEFDASIMNGSTRQTGSVGALKGFRHPISAARLVMEQLPHELVVGEGAARLASEYGLEESDSLTEEMVKEWKDWLVEHVEEEHRSDWPNTSLAPWVNTTAFKSEVKDTAIVLGRDGKGQFASATSTSGWPYKYPGRLGDSPIVGAGHYCHTPYGAAACTDTGELSIRASTARSVVLCLKMGMSVEQACYEAAKDIRDLKGGYIANILIYAVDKEGEHFVLSTQSNRTYCIWQEGMSQFESRNAAVFS